MAIMAARELVSSASSVKILQHSSLCHPLPSNSLDNDAMTP
jgi:hypothetical protein